MFGRYIFVVNFQKQLQGAVFQSKLYNDVIYEKKQKNNCNNKKKKKIGYTSFVYCFGPSVF